MKKWLAAAPLWLMSGLVLAATDEMEGASAPVETVDMIYVVLFLVIFVGTIVGFFVYLWLNEKKQKPDQRGSDPS